ncbi:MAG: DUF2191 domain-containing protein [Verrucomicrobia bacterium]|nr:DUF2191 domain-containing protein [Verrucomicrobiota bacterium]
MKTTVDIADELLVEAKKAAADEHKTLRSLIEEGLKLRLTKKYPTKAPGIKWIVAEGGVPPEVQDRAAMYEWMDEHS